MSALTEEQKKQIIARGGNPASVESTLSGAVLDSPLAGSYLYAFADKQKMVDYRRENQSTYQQFLGNIQNAILDSSRSMNKLPANLATFFGAKDPYAEEDGEVWYRARGGEMYNISDKERAELNLNKDVEINDGIAALYKYANSVDYGIEKIKWQPPSNPNEFWSTLGQGVGTVIAFMASSLIRGASLFSKASAMQKLIGLGGGAVSGTLVMSDQYIRDAKAAGLEDRDAVNFGLGLATVIGMSERVGLDYIGNAASRPFMQSAMRKARGDAFEAGVKVMAKEGGEKGISKALQASGKMYSNALKTAGLAMIEGAGGEFVQEFTQTYMEDAAKQLYDNVFAEMPMFKENTFDQETLFNALKAGMYGAIIGGAMSSIGSMQSQEFEETLFAAVDESKNRDALIKTYRERLNKLQKEGKLDEVGVRYGNQLIDKISNFTTDGISPDVTNKEARYQAYLLLELKDELTDKIAKINNPNLAPDYIPEQIAMVERAMKEIANTNKPLDMGMVEKLLNDIEQKYKNPPVAETKVEAEVAPEQKGERVVEWEVGQTATEQAQIPETDIDGMLEGEQPEVGVTETEQSKTTENPLADVESTAKALDEFDKGVPPTEYFELSDYLDEEVAVDETYNRTISEAYHKAKADGSNPELVAAVENLLTPKTTTNEQDTQAQAKQAEEELLVLLIDEIDMEVANLSKKRGEKAKKELQKQLERKARAQKDLEDVRTELAGLRGEPTDGVETGVGEEVGTGEEGVTQEELETEATPTEQANPALKDVESTAKALEELNKNEVEKTSNIIGETLSKKLAKIDTENNSALTSSGKQIKFRISKSTDAEIGQDFLSISAIDNSGKKVGYAKFIDRGNNTLEGSEVEVPTKFQKQGIASAIYSFADAKGYNVKQSVLQTPEGKSLWNSLKRKQGTIKSISEAYHQAKADGSNPELVQAVEELLGQEVGQGVQETAEQAPQVRPQKQVKANQKIATQEVAESRGEDVKDMEVLYSNQFRNLPVIDDTDTDAMLTYEAEGMPTGLDKDKVPPQIRKRVEKLMDKGYLYYDEGNFYLTPKGAEIVDAIDARLETRKGVKEGTDLFPDEANIEENKLTTAEAKSVADKIRGLKINTKGKAFDATLGLPVAIYNGAVELIATSVEGGMMLKNAIAKAMKYIDEQMGGKNWNKGLFAKDMNVRFAVTLPNGERAIVERDTSKKTAKVIDGWYLPIEQKVLNNKQDKMPANNWAGLLRSKEDEDLWTGVRQWLESKGSESVTKKELQDFIKNNRVEIVKVVKGDNLYDELYDLEQELSSLTIREKIGEGNTPNDYRITYSDENRANEIKSKIDQINKQDIKPKFSQYVLEGEKENYKEVLVTLPTETAKQVSRRKELAQIDRERSLTKSEQDEYDNLQKTTKGEKSTFKSSHFDEPNILVHLRMDTRTDADGNKVLFLEELQSDWGQQGKKEGFAANKENEKELSKNYEEQYKLELKKESLFQTKKVGNTGTFTDFEQIITNQERYDEIDKQLKRLREKEKQIKSKIGNIPTAPFVTDTNSWVKLGLKVALQEAVAQGADKIAWSTGTQQFERWGSEKIDWVRTRKPNGGSVIVKDLSKAPVVRGRITQNLASISSELDPQKEINRIAEKWGLSPSDLEFQITTGVWNISIQEQVEGTAFEGVNVDERALSEQGITITSKEELRDAIRRNLSRERNDAEIDKLTERIWNRMQNEESGTSLPRKEGMEKFYGSPTEGSLGIVGNVAKSLFKQEPKTVSIETAKNNEYTLGEANYVDGIGVYDGKGDMVAEFDTKAEANKFIAEKSNQTQHSIEVTPELKRQVEKGLPMFGNVDVKIGENTLGSAIAGANMLDQAFKAGVDLSQSVEDNIQEMEDKGIIKKDCK